MVVNIGNATSSPGWNITASNIRMQNGIGVLYGSIKHTVTDVPAWGDRIGIFPNHKNKYWIPLTLFSLDGEIILSAAVNTIGEIKLYRPDYVKLNAIREYNFFAVYFG